MHLLLEIQYAEHLVVLDIILLDTNLGITLGFVMMLQLLQIKVIVFTIIPMAMVIRQVLGPSWHTVLHVEEVHARG